MMQRNQPKDQQTSSENGDSNAPNADDIKQSRRGRPRKLGKLKVSQPIVATGKGRGRPKKPPASTDEFGDDLVANHDIIERALQIRQSKTGSSVEARGRPRKEKVYSDSENLSDDEKPDYEERRPVGRPSTGAVNLNIVRTGRGQGRPRKANQSARLISIHSQSNDNQSLKKRGRPHKGGIPYERTGKPRGRPKLYDTTPQNSCEKTQEGNLQSGGETEDKEDKTLSNSEIDS